MTIYCIHKSTYCIRPTTVGLERLLNFSHGALSLLYMRLIEFSPFHWGFALGTNGINVAHELGHRKNSVEKIPRKSIAFTQLLYALLYRT